MNDIICPLCEQEGHTEPWPSVLYGLTCPGIEASQSAQEAFRSALINAQFVEAQYGTTAACNPSLVGEILGRNDAALARFDKKNPLQRAPVSHQELVQDCALRTPQVAAQVAANALLRPIQFEPPENLRVPGEVPLPTKPLSAASAKRVGEAEDCVLFLTTQKAGS